MAYTEAEARRIVVEAGRKLLQEGLVARTWGNVSARVSESQFVITPSGMAYDTMAEEQLVRFRVGNVYKNCYIRAYLDGERIFSRKKQVAAPGEMEQIKLKKEQLLSILEGKQKQDKHELVIQVEE